MPDIAASLYIHCRELEASQSERRSERSVLSGLRLMWTALGERAGPYAKELLGTVSGRLHSTMGWVGG